MSIKTNPVRVQIDQQATMTPCEYCHTLLAPEKPGIEAAVRRLSHAMGNPAVQWDENSSIEEAVINEAIYRLTT